MDVKYRTKPIRVEAVQWQPDLPINEYPHWLWGGLDGTHNRTRGKIVRVGQKLQVATSAGTAVVHDEDWVVFYRSTSGELQVRKPDEFAREFEKDERATRVVGWREHSNRRTIGR